MKLRKVVFKKWIPPVYEQCFPKKKEGTGCYGEDYPYEGLFHQWASAYIESNEGFGNYTVALVELPDGTIEEVLPQNLKFVS